MIKIIGCNFPPFFLIITVPTLEHVLLHDFSMEIALKG
jgi:hypothetical protein